jgi:hypothetical protein
MPGQIKIDDGAGNYTVLTNGGSLGSDKTITIPNTTGTMALTSDITGGLAEAHNRWYISADITGTNGVISSNWVRSTSANDTFSGGDMSESSGVFTFPATGYWLIRMEAQIQFGAADTTFTKSNFTNDNFSTSSTLIQITTQGVSSTELFQTADRVFKVTDTANDKVNFELESYGGSTTLDCGGLANTNFQFTKLRDL